MKRLQTIMFLGFLLIFTIPNISAQGSLISTPLPLNQTYFKMARQQILAMPNYEMIMTFKDLTSNQVIMTTHIRGDQLNQKQFQDTAFYEYEDDKATQPSSTQTYQLAVFLKENRLYTNLFQQVRDMIISDSNNKVQDGELNNLWTEIYSEDTSMVDNMQLENQLLIPTPDNINKLSPTHIHYANGKLKYEAHRIDIPLNFMKLTNVQSLSYTMQSKIDYNGQESQRYHIQASSDLQQDFGHSDLYWHFRSVHRTMDEMQGKDLLSFLSFGSESYSNQESDQSFNSADVTNKLTDISLEIDPRKQSFYINMKGLSEKFDMNFIDQKSGKYGLRKYQLSIYVKPLTHVLPERGDLNVKTEAETNQMLEEWINNHEEDLQESMNE